MLRASTSLRNADAVPLSYNASVTTATRKSKSLRRAAINAKREVIKSEAAQKEIENKSKNISLPEKNRVNKDTSLKTNAHTGADLSNKKTKNKQNMKLKFKDITKESVETLASVEVYEAALEIDKELTKYAEQLDAEAKKLQDEKDKAATIQANLDKVTKEFDEIKAELKKEQDARAAVQVQADFNTRMTELNEAFEIDEAKSKVVAKQIRGLSKEDYAAWLADFEVLAAKKKDKSKDKDKADDKDDKSDADDDSYAADDMDDDGDDDSKDSQDDKDKAKDKKKKKQKSQASIDLEALENAKLESARVFNTITKDRSFSDLLAEAFDGIGEPKK